MPLAPAARAATRAARTLVTACQLIGAARREPSSAPAVHARRLQAAMAEVLAIHRLRVRLRGRLPAGPCVVVGNHLSYLDPIVLTSLLPCAPIAKGEVAGWPVLGGAAAGLGVIFVDRARPLSGARALRKAHAALRAGVAVLNFPEGTTTDGSHLLPFKRGVFGLARLAGVPVVPVAVTFERRELCWTGGATFLPHYLATAAHASLSVDVQVAAPLAPGRFGSAEALAAAAHHQLRRLLSRGVRDEATSGQAPPGVCAGASRSNSACGGETSTGAGNRAMA